MPEDVSRSREDQEKMAMHHSKQYEYYWTDVGRLVRDCHART